MTDEELEASAPEASPDIDLPVFVPQEQIAAAYYQQALLPRRRRLTPHSIA